MSYSTINDLLRRIANSLSGETDTGYQTKHDAMEEIATALENGAGGSTSGGLFIINGTIVIDETPMEGTDNIYRISVSTQTTPSDVLNAYSNGALPVFLANNVDELGNHYTTFYLAAVGEDESLSFEMIPSININGIYSMAISGVAGGNWDGSYMEISLPSV